MIGGREVDGRREEDNNYKAEGRWRNMFVLELKLELEAKVQL
jgi:hypothetical protein